MVGMNVRRCTPPFPRASGAGLMLVLFSLLLALHCVETGPVAALHHRDCSQQASACLWLRGGRGDSALEQRETIRKALSKKAAETESIFGMSSGEDDSSALADPLDDLGLSESEDPDLRDPLQTELVDAAAAGKFFAIEAIMSRGARVDTAGRSGGTTAMHAAASSGRCALLALLASKGADPDVADAEGRTPLHLAVLASREPAVLVLLELGANADVADRWGFSPLHIAAEQGKVRCAERLLDGGAGGTVHDNKGRTPWTVAMAAGGDDQQKVAQLLAARRYEHDPGAAPMRARKPELLDVSGFLTTEQIEELQARTEEAKVTMFGAGASRFDHPTSTPQDAALRDGVGEGGEEGAGEGFEILDYWTRKARAFGASPAPFDEKTKDAEFDDILRQLRETRGGVAATRGEAAGEASKEESKEEEVDTRWHTEYLQAKKMFPFVPPPVPGGIALASADGENVDLKGSEVNALHRCAAVVQESLREMAKALPRRDELQGGGAMVFAAQQARERHAKGVGDDEDSGELAPELGFWEEPVKGIVDNGDGAEGGAGGGGEGGAGRSAWWGWNLRGEMVRVSETHPEVVIQQKKEHAKRRNIFARR